MILTDPPAFLCINSLATYLPLRVCVCVCVCTRVRAHALSCVQLFVTPWTVARQALPARIGVGCHLLRQVQKGGPSPLGSGEAQGGFE